MMQVLFSGSAEGIRFFSRRKRVPSALPLNGVGQKKCPERWGNRSGLMGGRKRFFKGRFAASEPLVVVLYERLLAYNAALRTSLSW